MERLIVIEDYTASYADPIRFAPGDLVRLTGREDIWDGWRWLWAIAPDGREGWIPDSFSLDGDDFVASEAYSAMELTCAAGEKLLGQRCLHGWVWCEGAGGSGWVPERNLRSS
ncbi:MAG: SH3 domain-containing protein [Pseudomonadota bacterium]